MHHFGTNLIMVERHIDFVLSECCHGVVEEDFVAICDRSTPVIDCQIQIRLKLELLKELGQTDFWRGQQSGNKENSLNLGRPRLLQGLVSNQRPVRMGQQHNRSLATV